MSLTKEEKDKIEQTFKEISALSDQQNSLYENLLEDLNFEQYTVGDTEDLPSADPELFLFDAVYNSQSGEDLEEAVTIVEKQIEKHRKENE
jgi:hypothetical protein